MAFLKLAFFGTPDFAVPTLARLTETGHEIVAVYTQPARPRDRGQRVSTTPVQSFAERHDLPLRTPQSLKTGDEARAFRDLHLDAAVIVAYGLILPKPILETPKFGCLNMHPSLLPRWRGAAPIQRAVLEGDATTGITIMLVDEGLDSGPILLQKEIQIHNNDTAGSLEGRLSELGAELMKNALEGLASGQITPQPQADVKASYAKKLSPAQGKVDWRLSAVKLERQVRAFDPWPGSWFELKGTRIGLRKVETVLDDRLTIATGAGTIRILKLQRAGRAVLKTSTFLRGYAIPQGTQLPLPKEPVEP